MKVNMMRLCHRKMKLCHRKKPKRWTKVLEVLNSDGRCSGTNIRTKGRNVKSRIVIPFVHLFRSSTLFRNCTYVSWVWWVWFILLPLIISGLVYFSLFHYFGSRQLWGMFWKSVSRVSGVSAGVGRACQKDWISSRVFLIRVSCSYVSNSCE